MCAAPRPPLINITIKKRAGWSAGTSCAEGWTPAGTLRRTQNRRVQSDCRCGLPSGTTPKNSGKIMNRIFDSQNLAAFYDRRTRLSRILRYNKVTDLDLSFIEHVNFTESNFHKYWFN